MPIAYETELNAAQWEAVRSVDGPLLVIAGAGSGKTRTIVYRIAYLVENGTPPESILLLTFTRKASQEMLMRAGRLLGADAPHHGGANLANVRGGTFHSFAYRVLRRTPPPGYTNDFTIMDRPDQESVIKEVKSALKLGKGDRSYPKAATIVETLSKARNKELDVAEILARESFHLSTYAEDFIKFNAAYRDYKQQHNLLDYDDLLFQMERLLTEQPDVRDLYRSMFRHVMIDEYQDTNLVQARLVQLLTPHEGRVMAVGDDAQSIYAFRGANVRNILDFPKHFPGAKVVKLEQNYRSMQPILDLTNEILSSSAAQFRKHLFSERTGGPRPELMRPLSDRTQAAMVLDKIFELLRSYPPEEIAVLFRAGYQSYHVETQLAKMGLAYQKYGGLRFSEAAHVKDVLAYLRCVRNPGDRVAWQRIASHVQGVGPKTALKVHEAHLSGDKKKLDQHFKRYPELQRLLDFLHDLRTRTRTPGALVAEILKYYQPTLEALYPDDYPRREKGLEELGQIAVTYTDMDQLLGDLSLEQPEQRERQNVITLSTIHQAKGLEWKAVLVIDLVEERFPSRHAMNSADDYEEERRLLYVACTRAKDYLGLFAPRALFKRGAEFSDQASISPFLREISPAFFQEYHEGHLGVTRCAPQAAATVRAEAPAACLERADSAASAPHPDALPFCRHKIFGRGKIVTKLPPNKYRVNFPGFGLKVILEDYLDLET